MTPVVIDGVLWVSIALWGTMQAMLTTDEAYKYISPSTLFWSKFWVACLASACGSLKAFRSTSYAQHLQVKQDAAQPPPGQEIHKETITTQKVTTDKPTT